jgi:membrane-bound lytic murein transglycosylase D
MLAAAVTEALIVGMGWYLPCALLLSIGAVVLWGMLLGRGSPIARAPERGLALAGTLLALALVLPTVWRATGATRTGVGLVEVWSGPRVDGHHAPATRVTIGGTDFTRERGPRIPSLAPAALAVGFACLATGALFCLAALMLRRRQLGRHCAELPVVKRVGRVRLCASDRAPAPFAARFGGVAFIVVPTALWTDSRPLRMVIAHEAHHHRRGDLRAAILLGYLRALFFWNPFLATWERVVAELQDVACDRRVLDRLRVPAIDYGRALLWAAEAARGQRYVLVGSRGIADGSTASLARRIDMLDKTPAGPGRVRTWLVGGAACALLAGVSWIAQGAVDDHRVTRTEIQTLAGRIQESSGFPVLVDDQVVARINQWVAVPETRELMRKAMARMSSYRGMIESTLRARHLPAQLLGMVMAESRFDNEAQPNTPIERRSAGLWQLIPSTSRRLGLQVSPAMDERLEPRRATEAAATLMGQLFDRYGDWQLAVAAYNAGENKVDALAASGASKDEARARVLAGEEEHARYVRSVMASIILIDNPLLLK